MLLLGACPWPLAQLRADYRDDIGYTKLQIELGPAMPTGSGVAVSQIEAPEQVIMDTRYYLPDTASAEFSGKTFTVVSPAGGISGHATTVGQNFYGSASSVSPGITAVHNYEANDWIGSGFLNHFSLSTSAPKTEAQKITNSSWVGTIDNGGTGDVDVLRRFDYAIQQSGFLGAVGLNNGVGAVPVLLASSYNGVSVGRRDGVHSYGTTTADGAGRMKPELVAPGAATSFSTPLVASAAALLSQGAPVNAKKPVTMKAILMAGATKSQFPSWSRSATRPLDAVFGAGQVNVYSSYHILAAGQQGSSTSTTVSRKGWDYTTTAATSGSRLYFFDIPAGGMSSLSVVLTWNRVIADTIAGPAWGSPSSELANLTLKLFAASGFTLGALADSSTSAMDNVEHVWQPALAPGRYAMEITSNTAGVTYGIAWNSVPVVTVTATMPEAAEFGTMPGQFTFTRGGDTGAALTVSCKLSGTATNGTDCVAIPTSVTIPAGASFAAIPVTPIADDLAEGDETMVLTLVADPSYALVSQTSATVTIHDRPIDAWRFSKFTAAELADPLQSGDLADFEKDNIVTLSEYAFGLEPKTPDASGLPSLVAQPGGTLAIAYTRVKAAVDIAYTVEVSNDLATWFSGVSYTSLIGTSDHGATETITVRSLLAPGVEGRQFMRVRVTRQ